MWLKKLWKDDLCVLEAKWLKDKSEERLSGINIHVVHYWKKI